MISISPGQLILISSSISISSFKKHFIFKIFSEHIVSLKPTRKRHPLICLCWLKSLSKELLWKRTVNMKSYPSSNKPSIRLAWHLKVRIRALVVDRKRMNCSSNGTLSLYQFSIQSASALQNSDIPSPVFAAWLKMWFENWTLELEKIHHVLKIFKNSASFFFSGK